MCPGDRAQGGTRWEVRGLGEHTAGRAHLACEAGEGLAEEATHELKLGEGGVSRVGKAVRRVLPVEGMVFVKLGWRQGDIRLLRKKGVRIVRVWRPRARLRRGQAGSDPAGPRKPC